MSMSELMLSSGTLAALLRNTIASSGKEGDHQVSFLSLSALAVEQAILMQEADSEVFKEFGGLRQWVHDMVDTAITEMEHAIALRGQRKN